MSDRTPSSVRTGTPSGDASAPAETPDGEQKPVSATQTIPGASTPRSSGVPTGSSPAVPPTGAPPVPPATGAGAAVPPSTGAAVPPSTGAAVPPSTGGTPAQAGFPGATAGPATDTNAPARGRVRGQAKSRGPRRARLQLRHIDTWSALKISLVLSIALFFIWMVAVAVLYGVLSALGVFDTLNDLFGQLGSASGSDGGGGNVITPGLIFWGAAVIGAINVVLMTALCTVGTFIYNLCSDLVGGLELTLSERD